MGTARQHGAMLIELMIGMFIGLLTTLAIVQVLSFAEGQRRAAISGGDAQVSGAVTLHTLQRELRQAGYGLMDEPAAMGCALRGNFNGDDVNIPFAPVVVVDNGDLPDAINVLTSGRKGAAVPLDLTETHPSGDLDFVVKGTFTVAPNDYLVAVPKTWSGTEWCTMFRAATVTATTITHATMAAYAPVTGYNADSYLVNLGSSVRYRSFAINEQNVLQMTELGGGGAQDVATEIVNLQAYYGKDTNGDQIIDSFDNVAPTTAAGWLQVMAIRVAIVSRSMEYEKEEVTTANPEWEVGSALAIAGTVACSSGSGQCIHMQVSHLPGWQHYRYKVYDTLIPLRNVLWNLSTSSSPS